VAHPFIAGVDCGSAVTVMAGTPFGSGTGAVTPAYPQTYPLFAEVTAPGPPLSWLGRRPIAR